MADSQTQELYDFNGFAKDCAKMHSKRAMKKRAEKAARVRHFLTNNDKCDEALLRIAHQYLTQCPDRMPSLEGLCSVCAISLQTAKHWKDQPKNDLQCEFADIANAVLVQQARECLNTHPDQTLDMGPNAKIAIRVLAQHGYREQVEQTGTQVKEIRIMHFGVRQVDSVDVTATAIEPVV